VSRPAPCPCQSGLRYADCCEPLHRGAREAPDAAALMRSRFAAFARGEVAYLWKTLHPAHPLRAEPERAVLASLRRAAENNRYQTLAVLDAEGPDADGVARVLFRAGVFTRGRDVGFAECSEFAHDGVGWRYLRGVTVARTDATTIARFRTQHPDVEGA